MILNAARLIAPVITQSTIDGHDWVISILKDSDYKEIQSEIEMSKAMVYIEQRDISSAIGILKSFEKKDRRMMTIAASNLSFLYLLEKDYINAEKYCDIALKFDRYNCKALVNKGNCFYHQNDFERAKENYLEAIGVQADCLEALYNLAFVNKKLNAFMEALTALEKLKSIVNNQPEVLFQLANIFELLGDNKNALKYFDLLSSAVPRDPSIHCKLGTLYSSYNDEAQAFHHFSEAHRLLPTDLNSIAWLGIFHVKGGNFHKAALFFEIASKTNPRDFKWKLMIASCYRRMDKLTKALQLYKEVHEKDGDNVEALRFIGKGMVSINQKCKLVRISSYNVRNLEKD